MNKGFFSRVILVILVALLGTMFLAPSIAFGANATDVPEAVVNYDNTFAELERMGFKFTIYDVEEDGMDIMNEHDNIENNELIIIFNTGKKYDIFLGENISEKFGEPADWEFSHMWMSRTKWKNEIISEHIGVIYDEISKFLISQNDVKNAQNVNPDKGFRELVVNVCKWALDNPLSALVVVLAIIAVCMVGSQLCKLMSGLISVFKAMCSLVKTIIDIMRKFFKKIEQFIKWLCKRLSKKK